MKLSELMKEYDCNISTRDDEVEFYFPENTDKHHSGYSVYHRNGIDKLAKGIDRNE